MRITIWRMIAWEKLIPSVHQKRIGGRIANELLMMLRGKKKTAREVSLFEPIGTDREGNEINLLDVIFAVAAEKQLQIAFNPSPFTEELLKLPLHQVKWWLCNEIEGGQITGEQEPRKILEAMVRKFPNSAKLGHTSGNSTTLSPFISVSLIR